MVQTKLMIEKNYARIGPQASQRLISFGNGTCLSFGPEVSNFCT
jgi:hypothetical protein